MMYFELTELPLKFKHIYEGILEKDKSYRIGGASGYEQVDKLNPYNKENMAQLVIFKRDHERDVCYPFQLGDEHIYVMHPYYSKFSFCPEGKERVYKKFKLKDWEKAYNIMVDFETGKIENDVYYEEEIDWEAEERKEKRKRNKMKKEVKKYLDENKINYEFVEEKENSFDMCKFIINKEKNIKMGINWTGDTYVDNGYSREWIDTDSIYTIAELIKG